MKASRILAATSLPSLCAAAALVFGSGFEKPEARFLNPSPLAESSPGFLSDQGVMEEDGYVEKLAVGFSLDELVLNCWFSYSGELWMPAKCWTQESEKEISILLGGADPTGTSGMHWRMTISY